jgi:hypothetical protein
VLRRKSRNNVKKYRNRPATRKGGAMNENKNQIIRHYGNAGGSNGGRDPSDRKPAHYTYAKEGYY